MNFPDRNHLLQLRKELWQRPHSRAAVMVGAGFSLNARPFPGVETQFPTWRGLIRAMFEETYPAGDTSITDREERFKRSNPLRIASEYEAAFKRQKLESFLRRHLPDSGHEPGPVHELLMQLPWRDVFTTNYDTLLERTEVAERAYHPVTTIDDLTSAVPPRIIKLHGTLPSQTPFIVTEEDYRTYPRCFAPFVNTVRQSLIENSFVLIGFSGDDPNFLEWIGWIRDELDDRRAPIYLVSTSTSALSPVQRSFLEKRGVTPIDLVPVFPAQSQSPASAIRWFLENLQVGRPPGGHKWPKGNTVTQEAKDHQPSLLIDGLSEPEEVSFPRPDQGIDEETGRQILRRWIFERGSYPGWLVAPDRVRYALWSKTKPWIEPLIEFSKGRSAMDRVLIWYELNWRMEVSMMPLFESTKEPFEAAVADLFRSLSEESPLESPSIDWHSLLPGLEVKDAWLELAFALLREAREIYDAQRWNYFKELIDRIIVTATEFSDRCHYERALWMMWNIRRPEAREILDKWSPSPDAVLATMQKAGLLAEVDALNESKELLRSTLHRIRRSSHTNVAANRYLLSLEGWCTYLMYEVETKIERDNWAHGRGNLDLTLRDIYSDRWQELQALECSPWPILDHFDSVLIEEPPGPSKREQIVQEFDPGSKVVKRHIRGNGLDPWLPAFACIRMYEQVGIPAYCGGNALANACKWVAPFTSFWSPALLIRAGRADDLREKNFLDRPQVANMNDNLARNIHRWAMEALKREQAVLTGNISSTSFLGELLEVLIVVLSRLTVRLNAETLQEAFSVAIQLHAEPGIYSHHTLHESSQSWFGRLFTAASDSQLRSWLPDLIRFPLPEVSKRSRGFSQWHDPITALFDGTRLRAIDLSRDNSNRTSDAITWLLERTRSEVDEGWRRAAKRVIDVYDLGIMTGKQETEMASLLWDRVTADGFPDIPHIYLFKYGYMPAHSGIDVVTKVRHYLLGRKPVKAVSEKKTGGIAVDCTFRDALIINMAYVSKPIVHVPYEPKGFIEWNREEAMTLWTRVIEWWHSDKRAVGKSFFGSEEIVAKTEYAGLFLRHAVLPKMQRASDDEWKELLAFLDDARRRGVYLTAAWPYVLIHRPDDAHSVEGIVIDDLSSDVEEAVDAGANALRHWVHLASAELLRDPSERALDALLHRVVFRRPTGAASCLQQIALLLKEKPDFFSPGHVDLMVSSLVPWLESISLPMRDGRDGDFQEQQRPELRELLGRLASELGVWLRRKFPDRAEPAAISELRSLYRLDTLPEVRRSFNVRER